MERRSVSKLNIVLVEYINRNLGDTVIAESARFFLKEALKQAGITDYMIHEYNMYREDMELIRYADLIVFAGGGLIKYKREKFHQYVPDIIAVAQQENIPVYIHATGVEGYEESDSRCMALKKAVNSPCVKGITVRDDYETFRRAYLNSKKEWLDEVLDSAAFSSVVYDCHGKKDAKKIGLGVARGNLFSDYGITAITKQYQLDFWKNVIENLNQMGYQWEIFCNGLADDVRFAMKVLEYVGERDVKNHLVSRPTEGCELAETISQYRGIIACRLHTNIIAFSEGVPSIGLVWNDKLLQWGERIGYPERFVKAADMQAEPVIDKLQKAMQEGCRKVTAEEQKRLLAPLKEFVQKYGKMALAEKRRTVQKSIKWEDILICNALGGKNGQYCEMNSPETIMDKYHKGFRYFEADIKLTSDDKLVCVNGWTAKTYGKLGIPVEDETMLTNGISYGEFMRAKYYDAHYAVTDYEGLLSYLERMPQTTFLLDARNNSVGQMRKIAEIIRADIDKNPQLKKRLVIRVMSAAELGAVKETGISVMYDIPSKEECHERKINFADIDRICKDTCVEWLSVRRYICSALLMDKLREYNKKICAIAYNSFSEIQSVLAMGADMVATDYLEVDALNSLTDGKDFSCI